MQKTTIEGVEFEVGMLPAMRAWVLLPRLGKAAGPMLSQAMQAVGSGKVKLAEMNVGALGAAVEAMFTSLTPDELDAITRELFSTVRVKEPSTGKTTELMPVIDTVLQGKMGVMALLLAFVIKANYGNFGVALAGLAARSKAKSPAPSEGSPSP